MRLSKIKLAGFKSFVDPTTLVLPSNLIGIVGPNGCGKSNIIDAVKWVMGESSAKVLRGASMSDVIFSGSSVRKPVGSAQVELIFDNSDSAIGGEYASYSEISVKRTVSRDGQSSYFLNGNRCRKRDITDIFLGTGLGSRSYSIIEQGMISRIVEARPEEIRVYLEEAAGISKYKERRRETENRIRHTRENLERLQDLQEEISKQLAHLQRQAKAAERYKEYKTQLRLVSAKSAAMTWQIAADDVKTSQNRVEKQKTELEKAQSLVRQIESELEKARAQQIEKHDQVNAIQTELYQIMAKLNRVEQAEAHTLQDQKRFLQDIEASEHELEQLRSHEESDRLRLKETEQWLAKNKPDLDRAGESWMEQTAVLDSTQEQMDSHRQKWELHQQSTSDILRKTDVLRTQAKHLEQSAQRERQHLQQIEQRLGQLPEPVAHETLTALEEHIAELETSDEQAVHQNEHYQNELIDQRTLIQNKQSTIHQIQKHIQQLNGRLSGLQALQKSQDNQPVKDWLDQQQLGQLPTLIDSIQVEAGWENAVELVLEQWLTCHIVDQTKWFESSDLPKGLILGLSEQIHDQKEGLNRYVGQAPDWVRSILANIQPVENSSEVNDFSQYATCIDPSARWRGPGFVKTYLSDQAGSGALSRAHHIREIEQQLSSLENELNQEQQSFEKLKNQLKETEKLISDWSQQSRVFQKNLSQKRSEYHQIAMRNTQREKQFEQLTQEKTAHESKIKPLEDEQKSVTQELKELLLKHEQTELTAQHLRQTLDQAQFQLKSQQQKNNDAREFYHQLQIAVEKRMTEHSALAHSLKRMEEQQLQQQNQNQSLKAQLSALDQPLKDLDQNKQKIVKQRADIDARMLAARKDLQSTEAGLRDIDQKRQSSEQALLNTREQLEALRLTHQSLEIKANNLKQSVSQFELGFDDVMNSLSADEDLDTLLEEIEGLSAKIKRLEPVNLAAISEFEQQSERKSWLDEQAADLNEALGTLEKAIQKIDRETRTLFKDTFEKVNQGMQKLFPNLFGGGHAYLELTEDNLLDTGVAIMARPPGKRVSNIHLLSGGEKALTAVAFVFAIFELNPAPFCMLDEVDAPLDDANVGRFSEMVRQMSERVQFVFVSHNKVTMEIAHQLSGVTMREPGVSRLVQVDLAEATRLIDA